MEYPVKDGDKSGKVYKAIQQTINAGLVARLKSLLGTDKKLVVLIHGFNMDVNASTLGDMATK